MVGGSMDNFEEKVSDLRLKVAQSSADLLLQMVETLVNENEILKKENERLKEKLENRC